MGFLFGRQPRPLGVVRLSSMPDPRDDVYVRVQPFFIFPGETTVQHEHGVSRHSLFLPGRGAILSNAQVVSECIGTVQ